MMSGQELEKSIEDLYMKYGPGLDRMCRSYVNNEGQYNSVIEDCIQETFLTLANHPEVIESHPNITGWLYRTCKNRFTTEINKIHRRKKVVSFSLDDSSFDLPDPNLSNIEMWIDSQSANHYISQIIENLSIREQDVFKKYFLKHQGIQELSKEQHTTVSAIKSVIARIRQKIRSLSIWHIIILVILVQ